VADPAITLIKSRRHIALQGLGTAPTIAYGIAISAGICDWRNGSTARLHSSNSKPLMSALGQKRTSEHVRVMSALLPKADIAEQHWDVRFVPKNRARSIFASRPWKPLNERRAEFSCVRDCRRLAGGLAS